MAFYKKIYSQKMGVYYPLAVTMGSPVSTKIIAERLAQISTVSLADVAAVLVELPGVMADYMAQGKSVRLEGLGIFRYKLSTSGVENEADFDFQKQLKAIRVQFTPSREGAQTKGGTATRALVPSGIEWTQWAAVADEGGEDSSTTNPDGSGEEDTDDPLA